jgi:hypothetical protein
VELRPVVVEEQHGPETEEEVEHALAVVAVEVLRFQAEGEVLHVGEEVLGVAEAAVGRATLAVVVQSTSHRHLMIPLRDAVVQEE